jgi:uncharacterized membrane protein
MNQPASAPAAPSPTPRIPLVDLARGVALMAMVVFHFAYDLSYFSLIDTDVPGEPGWRWFARTIAGSFLTLVGISLVLATQSGLDRAAFLKRLAMVAGAALVVTVATQFAMPQTYIFFGILHHVALASVLGLAFLRAPVLVLIAAAALCFALPVIVDRPALDAEWLDAPRLVFLGLSPIAVRSADFVPVFPWFGWVLSGMALARLILSREPIPGWVCWNPDNRLARILRWCGRRSLAFYLIHQPVLIGAILLATQVLPVTPPQERALLTTYRRTCATLRIPEPTCAESYACTVAALKREGLWRGVLGNALTAPERERTTALTQACFRAP